MKNSDLSQKSTWKKVYEIDQKSTMYHGHIYTNSSNNTFVVTFLLKY